MVLRDRYLPVRSRWLHPGQQQGRRWPSSSSYVLQCVRADCGSSGGTPGNLVAFQSVAFGSSWRYNFTMAMTAASVYVTDDYAPSLTVAQAPDGWTADSNQPIVVNAHDGGTGIYQDSLTGPAGWHGAVNPGPTNGTRAHWAQDQWLQTTVNDLPEGDNLLTATAGDVTGNATSRPIHVKVDRTPPRLGFEGDLEAPTVRQPV